MEDGSQRIRFFNVISRLFTPFSRLFTPPTSGNSIMSKREAIERRRILISAGRFARSFACKANASQKIRQRRLIIQFFRHRAINFRFNARDVRPNHSIQLVGTGRARTITFMRNYFNEINRTASNVLKFYYHRSISRRMCRIFFTNDVFISARRLTICFGAIRALLPISLRLLFRHTSIVRMGLYRRNVTNPFQVERRTICGIFSKILLRFLSTSKAMNFTRAYVG